MTRSILDEVRGLGYDATDMRLTGFNNFYAKQRLYEIMWEAERQLERCSMFVGEDEWLQENNKSGLRRHPAL